MLPHTTLISSASYICNQFSPIICLPLFQQPTRNPTKMPTKNPSYRPTYRVSCFVFSYCFDNKCLISSNYFLLVKYLLSQTAHEESHKESDKNASRDTYPSTAHGRCKYICLKFSIVFVDTMSHDSFLQ